MKAYCLSHRKDVDGLGSASLSVAATGGELILSDYDDLVENLRRIPDDAERVVLSDLGADSADFPEFLEQMERLAAHAKITYIDHHYMSEGAKRKLRKAGVEVVHDTKECASMLTYRTFKDQLPERARLIALCGAVTDYMDDSPLAKKMMEQSDRQFVLLEASMLSYALGRKEGKEGFPEMVVRELSRMKHPHEILGVPQAAVEELEKIAQLGEFVKAHGTKKGRLAYMVTGQYSTGNIAKLLIGAFEVPVGVAMKEKKKGWYEVSLRGTSECKVHLGRTVAKISVSLGGSGGGHRKAAGCRVPVSKVDALIRALAKKV
ncbi:MAG: DHHA1 domain-containing protein [Thaumarchaeota archaeon]|nr:DHHA1 domain-containing protein [Nitrososphaerota archaeon]